jgi:hypothetical protein
MLPGPWAVLLLLGAVHGLNPGMGWLFAVALGLQEKRAAMVWRALGPLALGHALAIGLALGAAAFAGMLLPLAALKWIVAVLLFGFGIRRIFTHRHPRFGGMRASTRDLVLWSLLMASAHGAGLMVVPLVQGQAGHDHAAHVQAPTPLHHAGVVPEALAAPFQATVLHTVGYLLVTGLLALVVYHKMGLRLLRTAWVNLDLIWAGALVLTAIATVSL